MPPAAVRFAQDRGLRLIRYDFVKYATGAERKRLLEKWERDVHAQPR